MCQSDLHVVTGAFGFSGKYIAARLLRRGYRVRTLTNSPQRANPFGGQVEVRGFSFDDSAQLTDSLQGARVLYNTYWVRFNHASFKHAQAVENTLRLFDAAKRAGVGRVVHVSITNASESSPLEYFKGKALLERALTESGLSCAILRPAVLFGREDVLINNIAWVLRKFPVFGVFGNGLYRLQPIYVDDLAKLAVQEGGSSENRIIDAIGPETFTYRELVQQIGEAIGKKAKIVSVPPRLGYWMGRCMGWMVRDVVVTWEEIEGLMAGLLCTNSPPVGQTRLSGWARENASVLGNRYANELARRRNRSREYGQL
jgi:NADH dehydrogenase